jgi:hypothetical protein
MQFIHQAQLMDNLVLHQIIFSPVNGTVWGIYLETTINIPKIYFQNLVIACLKVHWLAARLVFL